MLSTYRARLTATMIALSLGVLGLASALVYGGVRWALVRNLDQALLALARTEIASAFDEPGGFLHVHDQAPAAIALGGALGYEKVAEVVDAKGEVVARTSNLVTGPRLEMDAKFVARAIAGEATFVTARRAGLPYRAVLHPFEDAEGGRLAMVVAISRRPLDLTLEVFAGVLLVALVLAGALVALASGRLARRLTRPLDRIATAAQEVGASNLAARIPDVSPDRELRSLVGLLNAMLARIEAAFASQRRFVADASHELRSPLSNLRGTVEVALRRPRPPNEYRETLGVALREIERLARLVQDLLTLSRADAGRLALARRPADLAQLAARALEMHAARASGRNVELRLEATGPATVDGDPDRLREVIDNLLDNAIRVAPAASTVRVRVTSEVSCCVLEVEDAGPGLSEDEQLRVFERFARGSAAGGDGAGLGLAIARAVAEAHGGRLGVRSRPGSGATFRLELPAGAREASLRPAS